MDDEGKVQIGAAQVAEFQIQPSYRFKLTEILKKLHSPELVIYSEASKEFIYLIKGESGGAVLREYVQLSPKCAELLEAWKLHLGKTGMSFILSLISAILCHPDGKSRPFSIRNSLDSVARLVIEDKLEDVYTELKSQESRRQNAALSLLASIVRRRLGFASDVARKFDFKLPVLSKLCGIYTKNVGKDCKPKKRHSTRRAFVEFAMSFLEIGNPKLLRWIIQQRDMYSGVLRGLSNDDSDTVIIVLSTLRDKVLKKDSLVPPSLRSVLFGSATLEQLSFISGNPLAGPVAEIAHDVLLMVCTDPQNGLMPGPNLKGNLKRLLDLTRKLKATEVAHHKQLLLAIAKEKMKLCSAYLDEFPYNLEPRSSSSWFSSIRLAADLVSNINIRVTVENITSHLFVQPIANIEELHDLLKCIIPRAFTRSVMNKGLLHSDNLVKHGSLRLVLELLNLLDNLITSLDTMIENTIVTQDAGSSGESIVSLHNLPGFNCILSVDKNLDYREAAPSSNRAKKQHLVSLKHYFQNEVRAELPDPQVLLKLLSSSSGKYSGIGAKRPANFPDINSKKIKSDKVCENIDIYISGLDALPTVDIAEDLAKTNETSSNKISELENDNFVIASEIWGLTEKILFENKPEDLNNLFQSKLLDALKFYLRAMPIAFEGSFDFFKILPDNPSSISINQKRSLLSLLLESIRQGNQISTGALYKHLHPLIKFLIFSQVSDVKSKAYTLVRAAMISTGAFDQNFSEIDAWLVFLPYSISNIDVDQSNRADALCNQPDVVISFLCEAISAIGNNLYKYVDQMRKLLSKLDVNDQFWCFSPLVICVLQKCLRLLDSHHETLKLHESSMISFYVGNTLNLIMHCQVDMRTLPSLIYMILYEMFEGCSSTDVNPRNLLCEWKPLKTMFGVACHILDEQLFSLHSVSGCSLEKCRNSFYSVLVEVEELLRQSQGERVDGLAIAFRSSILCASHEDILTYIPSVLSIIQLCFPSQMPFLSSFFFQESKLLVKIRELWPRMFFTGFDMVNQAVDRTFDDVMHVISNNNSLLDANCESTELSAFAFCYFLQSSSFYALFSAILSFATWESHSTGVQEVFPSKRMLELLQMKISEGSIDDSILLLKYVLFCTYHMFLLYKEKRSFIINELLLMCITLVQDLMNHLLKDILDHAGLKVWSFSSVGQYSVVIAELIFSHPIVTMHISNPLSLSSKLAGTVGHTFGSFLTTLKQNVHSMDECMVRLLKKLFDFLHSLSSTLGSSEAHNSVCESLIRIQNTLTQSILLSFRERIQLYAASGNAELFLPIFYIFQSLMDFISLSDILELVQWIFCKIESKVLGSTSSLQYAVSVGLYITEVSLDKLYNLLQSSSLKFKSDLLMNGGFKSIDVSVLPNIFHKILDLSLNFHLEQSDICLLKVVNFVYNYRRVKTLTGFLSLDVLLSSMIFGLPVKMLIHCIYSTSKIKAKILFLLTEVSPVHMSLFGKIFLAILDKNVTSVSVSNEGVIKPCRGKMTSDSKESFSDDEFLLLLPVALSYFVCALDEHGRQGIQPFLKIPITYANILLDSLFNWNLLLAREIFQEEFDEVLPNSFEEFNKFFCSSLIGKAVVMLHYFFHLNGNSIRWNERLKLFDSTCPQLSFFDELICCDTDLLVTWSCKESLKVVNEVVAKISFMRLLLFSQDGSTIQFRTSLGEENVNCTFLEKEFDRLNHSKLRFMNILVNTLDQNFKMVPLKVKSSVTVSATYCDGAFRFLEHLILEEIVCLSKEICSYSVEMSSFPFANHFIKSALVHRFEDPVTLKAIRCVLVTLAGSRFSFIDVLELLIGHSAFVKIILLNHAISDSSIFDSNGTLLQSLNSVLKLVEYPCNLQNIQHSAEPSSEVTHDYYSAEDVKLEVVSLLRVLFHLKDKNSRMGCFNIKELISLLLCGYGATQSQIDHGIFQLMNEIVSNEGPDIVSIAGFDYMWGVSILKMRKEKTHDVLLPSSVTSDCETVEEQKIHFRENFPVDSKVCAVTVLHLCNDRSARVLDSLESLLKDTSINYSKIVKSSEKYTIQSYEPSFILRFSIHCLSMRYLDPVEFSRVGLLAITFASISSSNEDLRKLGYECLGRLKTCLEDCQKSKDMLQLLLLLTCLQNGITEAWQEIPSVIAIFASEASITLLDHSQKHSIAISKFLMYLPRVNIKAIPLFHTLFENNSIHFRTDRLWILRLLYAGLNSSVDAKLYLKDNVLDVLLSYSASSLTDNEFKILTLMIVKKCVKLHILADHLVKECGLLPWLSSRLLFYGERLIGHQEERSSVDAVKLILEVANDVVSSSTICEWLQDCALEQLSEFSLLVLKLLVASAKLLKENIFLINAMIVVITCTVRLSQKRTTYQPHFTLSLECIFQLFQVINAEFVNVRHTLELGMHAVLMNTPTAIASYEHKESLIKFITLAAPTALWSNVSNKFLMKDLNSAFIIHSEEEHVEESLALKLLRWVSASIILGSVLRNQREIYASSNTFEKENTLSYFNRIFINACDVTKSSSVINESLAVLILHFQGLFKRKCILPSVASALCLLLLGNASTRTGKVNEYLNDNHDEIQSLCSNIRFPTEANPAWRWCFDQPWEDPSLSKLGMKEEEQACRSLLIVFSNAIGIGQSNGFPALCTQVVEKAALCCLQNSVK